LSPYVLPVIALTKNEKNIMFDSIKSFVFLSSLFISGVMLGVIYTPEPGDE